MKIAKLLILVAVHGTVLAGTAQGETFYTPEGRAIGYTTNSTTGKTFYDANNRIIGVTSNNPAPAVEVAPVVPMRFDPIVIERNNEPFPVIGYAPAPPPKPKGWKHCYGGADICTPAVLAKMNAENQKLLK
jgi:hypothetical protein